MAAAPGNCAGEQQESGRQTDEGAIESIDGAAAIAGAAGIPMSTHLYPEVAAHLMRVTETAHWLEWQDWADPILAKPFELEKGQLIVSDRPGAGISWNEEAVAKFAI